MKPSPGARFPRTAIAVALCAIFTPVQAAEGDEDAARLARPESTVSFGLGYVSKDNQRFGQYSGLRDDGGYGLLDLGIARRDDATGTWMRLTGRNLGLSSRELRFEHERQGDWGYFIDFSQTPRFNPFNVSTARTGIGSSVQGLGATIQDYQLKTERKALSFGMEKAFSSVLGLQVRFKNEEKDGSRMYGQGDTAGGVTNFFTDPINQTTRQFDTVLTYTGERLQLSGGYYGTSFVNRNLRLNVTGGAAVLTPIGLPPDNRSHQFNVAGGYDFTPTTRGNFKFAYGRITQNEGFPDTPVVPRTGLDGRIDTKLAQVALTARPLPKLTLLANYRREDRRDRTPIDAYLTAGLAAGSTLDGFNEPRSVKTSASKLEASYSLPLGVRAIGGVDYEKRERNFYRVRSVSARAETVETAYRAELRRSLSESVTGSVGYVHSDRAGSEWLLTVTNGGATGSNLIAPLHLADRVRDKFRATLNWTPTEALSLQFRADDSRDSYDQRTSASLGVRSGRAGNYAVDGAYSFSEKWQGTAWISYNDIRTEQASRTGANDWAANTRNEGVSMGLGLRGKPRADLDFGADLNFSRIRDAFGLYRSAGTGAIRSLPDINTKMTTFKLFGKYALNRHAGVRADYVYDHWNTDDWTWANFTYSDGTRITQVPNQSVQFIGFSYYYNFH